MLEYLLFLLAMLRMFIEVLINVTRQVFKLLLPTLTSIYISTSKTGRGIRQAGTNRLTCIVSRSNELFPAKHSDRGALFFNKSNIVF